MVFGLLNSPRPTKMDSQLSFTAQRGILGKWEQRPTPDPSPLRLAQDDISGVIDIID